MQFLFHAICSRENDLDSGASRASLPRFSTPTRAAMMQDAGWRLRSERPLRLQVATFFALHARVIDARPRHGGKAIAALRCVDDRVHPGVARHEMQCLFIVQQMLFCQQDDLRWGDLVGSTVLW